MTTPLSILHLTQSTDEFRWEQLIRLYSHFHSYIGHDISIAIDLMSVVTGLQKYSFKTQTNDMILKPVLPPLPACRELVRTYSKEAAKGERTASSWVVSLWDRIGDAVVATLKEGRNVLAVEGDAWNSYHSAWRVSVMQASEQRELEILETNPLLYGKLHPPATPEVEDAEAEEVVMSSSSEDMDEGAPGASAAVPDVSGLVASQAAIFEGKADVGKAKMDELLKNPLYAGVFNNIPEHARPAALEEASRHLCISKMSESVLADMSNTLVWLANLARKHCDLVGASASAGGQGSQGPSMAQRVPSQSADAGTFPVPADRVPSTQAATGQEQGGASGGAVLGEGGSGAAGGEGGEACSGGEGGGSGQ